MKRKILVSIALALLITVLLYMLWDMFFNRPESAHTKNALISMPVPEDTIRPRYNETMHFGTGLKAAKGVAVDRSDRIFVCGAGGAEIFDRDGHHEGGFQIRDTAYCIFADRDGILYLGLEDHIEKFDRSGKLLSSWAPCAEGAFITSAAVAGSDVYIADAANTVVYHYSVSGNMVNKIGLKDPERGIPGFVVPSPYFDLGCGKGGELWIVNPGRHKFEKYDREGALLASWGESSMTTEGFCGCCNPSNFAMLSDGSFVTSEKGIERIKVYWPDGRFRCLVAGPDAFTEGTRGIDLAVDSRDRIIALDPEKNQVRIFTKQDNGPD